MKLGTIISLMLGASLITAGSIAFTYFFILDNNNQSSDNAITQQVNGESTSSSLNVSQESPNGQLGINDSNSSSGQSESRLPGVDEFGLYDEYIDEENSLYVDIEEGDGEEVETGDKIAVLYSGWLTDGTLFDESKQNAEGKYEAFSFEVGTGQVIKGWDQAIVGMKQGGTRRIIVPPAAGYGDQELEKIPANSLLVFDVRLLLVEKTSLDDPSFESGL